MPNHFGGCANSGAICEVGLFVRGHLNPLDRSNHSAHAQFTRGALHHLLQSDGYSDHHPNRHYPVGYSAFDLETVEADAGHELFATQAERDTGQVLQGQVEGVSRNNASIPGGRRKPHRLPGSDGSPNAGPHRPFPGVDPGSVLAPGQPGRTVGKDVHLDPSRADILGGAVGLGISVVGPRQVGPHQHNHPGAGLCLHLGPAKDDHDAVDRPAAVGQPGDDALANAADDRVFLVHTPQRSGPLLDNIQCHWYRNPIFCHWWLGVPVPADDPQNYSGISACCGSPAI